MRISILITILITVFSSCDSKEKKEQKAIEKTLKEWFENPSSINDTIDLSIINTLKDSGRLENNSKEGIWIHYSIDTSELNQKNTLIVGDTSLIMNKSAIFIKETGNYLNNKREGIWTYFNAFNNKTPLEWYKIKVTTYKNGLKNGEEIIYKGDTPLQILNWENDVENGIGKIYDLIPPFNLKFKYIAVNGVQHIIESYYPNGKLMNKFSDTIINGLKLKYYVEYYENEKIKMTGTYKNNDEQFGKWSYYSEEGRLKTILNYENGKINGSVKQYHKNGQLWSEKVYKNGILWNVLSNYDKKGNIMDKGSLKNGTGTLKIYDENGNLTQEVEYVNGQEKK